MPTDSEKCRALSCGMYKKDFFISYNKADRAWAVWIAWQLEEEGYTTVIQDWDFPSGTDFIQEMHRASIETNRTLAVLSPDSLAAPFPWMEWSAALARDKAGEGILFPVRVRECEPDGLLGPIGYVDLVGKDEASARAELVARASGERAKSFIKPLFPGATSVKRAKSLVMPPFPGPVPAPLPSTPERPAFPMPAPGWWRHWSLWAGIAPVAVAVSMAVARWWPEPTCYLTAEVKFVGQSPDSADPIRWLYIEGGDPRPCSQNR